MKIAIVDYRMKEIYKNKIRELGYKTVDTCNLSNLYYEINGHVDIQFCFVKDKLIYTKNIVYEGNIDKIKELEENIVDSKVELVEGSTIVRSKYPYDIAYNACIIGDNFIHKIENSDSKIMEIVHERNINIIDVKQGYSKCSISIVDNNSVITDDLDISTKLKRNNIDALYLSKDKTKAIKLLSKEGYSNMNGFIGGATCLIDNTYIIFGDINKLEYASEILEYVKSKGKEIISFDGEDIIDYGGVILID